MKSSNKGALLVLAVTLAATQCACSDDVKPTTPTPPQPTTQTPTASKPATTAPKPAPSSTAPGLPPFAVATITLSPASSSSVKGDLRVEQRADGVWITGDVLGLAPGPHGFHIHEKGDCTAPDASSAGKHYAPSQSQHGAPTAPMHHAGDLGNIEADADGTATIAVLAKDVTLTGENSVAGRAVIIHTGPDDMTTQPSGNSGPPVACGVIRMTK